jgi:2-polyprenyl-3-methyl-5-hydroxy-6-metoxy-1,4-benzoquinol methylase
MHSWLGTSLDSLPTSQNDISRRSISIENLAKEFEIRKILDFGCGDGELISAIRGNFDVCGVEPENQKRNKLNGLGVRCVAGLADFDAEEQFDLVMLYHVIEHLYEPEKMLKDINMILRKGGLIIIETPNSCDALLTLYQCLEFSNFTYWSHHPYLYSKKSLSLLLERTGFEVLESDGVQRYSLANHLMWLSRGIPSGHVEWGSLFDEEARKSYNANLIREGVNDTLFFVAQKLD